MATNIVHITIDTPGILESITKEVDRRMKGRTLGPKIGIGVTTQNRKDVFNICILEILKFMPPGAVIAVVDDASTENYAEGIFGDSFNRHWRFDTPQGIAIAKNKCFELLEDCEHIFLFDDDTWPKADNWWKPYVESREPHLMYIFPDFSTSTNLNDTKLLYVDLEKVAYSHARGCMCYFKRVCLTVAGGMDPIFGRWGYEHPDLSNRIFNNGLTSFRYMDVIGSSDLIHSLDEHEAVVSTVPPHGSERQHLIRRNRAIYYARLDNKDFVPYKDKEDIILTCYFNGAVDPQRGEKWDVNGMAVQPLIDSLNGLKLVILTDCLPTGIFGKVEIVGVDTGKLNPYFQRWISYREYLRANQDRINKVFCVDATDVEVLRNPFPEMWTRDYLYTGDEWEWVANEWLQKYHKHPKLIEFYQQHARSQLLNAGLLGGKVGTVLEFMRLLIDFYCQCEDDAFRTNVPNAGATDMAAFNYIARKFFGDRIAHGLLINTPFKANERNSLSWFKHK